MARAEGNPRPRRTIAVFLGIVVVSLAIAVASALANRGGERHTAAFPQAIDAFQPGATQSEVHERLGEPRERRGDAAGGECWFYELPRPREYRFCFDDGGELILRARH